MIIREINYINTLGDGDEVVEEIRGGTDKKKEDWCGCNKMEGFVVPLPKINIGYIKFPVIKPGLKLVKLELPVYKKYH